MKTATYRYFRAFLLLFLCFMVAPKSWATHNRAGEITYVSAPQAGQPYRYVFTIHTYTKIEGGGSEAADRDSLDINFGDGYAARAPRTNGGGNGAIVGDNIKYNEYTIAHTYPAPFTYVVSMQDPNRIDQIINIQGGASVGIPFYVEDSLRILDPQFFGYNSSPVLYQPPIDYGNVGYPFIHNPNAFDPDGDSLVFELIVPKSNTGEEVPLYRYPDQVFESPDNNMYLDPSTGEFLWDSPQLVGNYNIAILIREFRNGVQIGTMVRDMQIIVNNLNNQPPNVEEVHDTCVVVGETLQLMVYATDPNSNQKVNITAYGGPFDLSESPAIFNSIEGTGGTSGMFLWNTTCAHIFSDEYTIVFKAEDNFKVGNVPFPLADLETWLVRVVPPPPQEVTAQIVGGIIQVSWNVLLPYSCQTSPKFRGFSVWRRTGCDTMLVERCMSGLVGTGYQKIADGLTSNTYNDLSAIHGISYSYRIVAEFADAFTSSNPPTPINGVSSMPSENVCIALPQDVPIITNVSIQTTQPNNGAVYVAWSKPRAEPLDTNVNLPPYRYVLYKTEGITGSSFSEVTSWVYDNFFSANDTVYVDNVTGNNTRDKAYRYKVGFYANGQLIGETQAASSVFLTATPADNAAQLSWDFEVPWLNYSYDIYRQNESGNFELLTTTQATTYQDTLLLNGKNYCYFVRAKGTYSTPGLIDPLVNDSQTACVVPNDNIPPCAPQLNVSNDCGSNDIDPNALPVNNLVWNNPNLSCADDVVGYIVYYQAPTATNFSPLATLEGADITAYQHHLENTLAGCYYVTAIDSFQNESAASNQICTENCVLYELPNVFTPNGDDDNELFVPRKQRFVSHIDLKIFNRWGQSVFETQNPNIEWNGTDGKTGKNVPDGVYYYTCAVLEQNLNGQLTKTLDLNGYVHVIRN